MERTKAEALAGTLDFIAKEKTVSGLLPKSVAEAADLLREQERELKTLRAAMATKDHLVTVEVTERNYRKEVRGTFTITDPRIFCGEIFVDALITEVGPPDWIEHTARSLARHGTAAWQRDIEEKTYIALQRALAAGSRRAKTPKAVECGASQSGGASRNARPQSSRK